MSNPEETVKRLKDGPVDAADTLTDEDLRQLVIHYATIVRNPALSNEEWKELGRVVIAAWDAWPKDVFQRFSRMIHDSANKHDYFWVRPATVNLKYGIK